MNVQLYGTTIQALAMREREDVESSYEQYPDTTAFWCMIDLVGSSNYRITHGPRAGYVRGEMFFSVIRATLAPCGDVRLLKEMGDAVLLTSASFRPLLEVLLLADQVASQIAATGEQDSMPFGIRGAIAFGTAKRLTRRGEDYLGSCIDQLARVMGVRSQVSNLLLHESVMESSVEILNEYSQAVEAMSQRMLTGSVSKGMAKVVYYRELVVDRPRLSDFREHFMPWRVSLRKIAVGTKDVE